MSTNFLIISNMSNKESIIQPIWSKKEYNGQDVLMFYLPEVNTVRNEVNGPHSIPTSCMYYIYEVVFYVDGKGKSSQLLDHMIKYAYFTVRIVDKDYLSSPCMCMYRGDRTLTYKHEIYKGCYCPIRVEYHFTTCVYLYFSKKFKGTADILCGYNGKLTRRVV